MSKNSLEIARAAGWAAGLAAPPLTEQQARRLRVLLQLDPRGCQVQQDEPPGDDNQTARVKRQTGLWPQEVRGSRRRMDESTSAAKPSHLMTLAEVAYELGLTRSAIYPKVYSGELAAVAVGENGRGLRVLRSSFDEYLKRLEREGERRFGGANWCRQEVRRTLS